ncbi:MAG: hypothetical protein K0R17_2077 [Rariglobus sp.]|jgi:hypothetical protein|nr:hypothetical protein [Rariglobus sp.]
MLTENHLQQLQALVDQHGGAQQAQLTSALVDLQKTIVGQSLLIRNLMIDLRNRHASDAALQALLTEQSLSGIYQSLGMAKQNNFSVSDANTAVSNLAASIANANNLANVTQALVKVATVFI